MLVRLLFAGALVVNFSACGETSFDVESTFSRIALKLPSHGRYEPTVKQEFWVAGTGGGFSARSYVIAKDAYDYICSQRVATKESIASFVRRYPMAALHLGSGKDAPVCVITATDAEVTVIAATEGGTLFLLRFVG